MSFIAFAVLNRLLFLAKIYVKGMKYEKSGKLIHFASLFTIYEYTHISFTL